jgi:hypothetical protein
VRVRLVAEAIWRVTARRSTPLAIQMPVPCSTSRRNTPYSFSACGPRHTWRLPSMWTTTKPNRTTPERAITTFRAMVDPKNATRLVIRCSSAVAAGDRY